MNNPYPLIFIHGLFGSSQGFKAKLLRGLFPDLLTPDFTGSLDERMAQLVPLLEGQGGWTLIGSSFGGLMAALYTCRHPQRVNKLVLLAPALLWPDFAADPPDPVAVPTILYHGRDDELLPLEAVKSLAEKTFENLTFHAVDDDHKLHPTVRGIDWPGLLGNAPQRG